MQIRLFSFTCFLIVLFFLGACGSSDGPDTPIDNKFDPLKELPPGPTETTHTNPNGQPVIIKETGYCKWKDGKYVSSPTVVTESAKVGENYFGRGGGCLYRPIRDVWAVTHNPLAVDWKEASTDGVKRLVDPDVSFLIESHYSAGPFFARQEWEIDWFQILKKETLAKPEQILINYRKVRGTHHIHTWKGSFQLDKLTEDVTSIVLYNEIRGSRIDEKSAAGGVEDIFNNLKKLSPDWRYLNTDQEPF